MRRAIHKALILVSLALGAAATGEAGTAGPASAAGAPFHGWFQGGMEAALAAAKTQQKPVFVYWGAVWCPPCNELKSHVFTQPRFAQLMQAVIPVYLDGDSTEAQLWADRLKVAGYPTLLLLGPDGKELTRFTEVVSSDELATALGAALGGTRPFSEALARARGGAADARDWTLLGYFDWEDPQTLGDTRGLLQALSEVLAHAERAPATVQAQLAGRLLERCAGSAEEAATDPSLASLLADLKTKAPGYIDLLLADARTAAAARGTLLFAAREVVGWTYAGAPDAARRATERRWLAAVESLRSDAGLSVLHRLWLVGPRLAFAKLDRPERPLPRDVVRAVQASAKAADKQATSSYERHAVIDDAAGLLADVGDVAGARRLLEAEIASTDTPWYYQASMADLELDQGHGAAALTWSEQAKASAKGGATRLQWIARDAQVAARSNALSDAALAARIVADATEFYQVAFTLPDGFSGRSGTRVERLERLLVTKVPKADRQKLVAQFAGSCGKLPLDVEKRCRTHFSVIKL